MESQSGLGEPEPSLTKAIATARLHTNRIENEIAKIKNEIAKINTGLLRFKKQMAPLPDGPSRKAIGQRVLRLLKQRSRYEEQLRNLQQMSRNMTRQDQLIQALQREQVQGRAPTPAVTVNAVNSTSAINIPMLVLVAAAYMLVLFDFYDLV
eukprot:m.13277 g.13277  ORF g.13277 m.13277 type:complete len:152 (-) comp10133_c0_seq2:18-473(-)